MTRLLHIAKVLAKLLLQLVILYIGIATKILALYTCALFISTVQSV